MSHLLSRHHWSLLHQSTGKLTIISSLPEIIHSISFSMPRAREQKRDDASFRFLENNTLSSLRAADLIEKYSALPSPESIKNQELKSPMEIIRTNGNKVRSNKIQPYSIRSTDKVALEEFDLKSALFKHMNKNKNANRNPANYHLYHANMEALIADEDAMDKEVAVKVKDHKRKHDSDDDEDDDDDEGPSARSNQGRSAKRRRPKSAASPLLGQLNLLRKMMTKVQRNHGSLIHLLPKNIQLLPQLDGRLLT
ncbi:hypothetical protein Tco_0103822 [Tanacetum coccineum]